MARSFPVLACGKGGLYCVEGDSQSLLPTDRIVLFVNSERLSHKVSGLQRLKRCDCILVFLDDDGTLVVRSVELKSKLSLPKRLEDARKSVERQSMELVEKHLNCLSLVLGMLGGLVDSPHQELSLECVTHYTSAAVLPTIKVPIERLVEEKVAEYLARLQRSEDSTDYSVMLKECSPKVVVGSRPHPL